MKEWVKKTAATLAGIGAVNWAIDYFTPQWNLVNLLASWTDPVAIPIAYTAVGVAGGVLLYNTYKKK